MHSGTVEKEPEGIQLKFYDKHKGDCTLSSTSVDLAQVLSNACLPLSRLVMRNQEIAVQVESLFIRAASTLT